MTRPYFVALLTLGLLCSLAANSAAQSYRMETDVYVTGRKQPECQTLTLVTDGLVYDFLTTFPPENPKGELTEVVVFNLSSGRVVLLDVKRSVKTVLTTDQILQLTASIKTNVPANNAVFQFAANPQFETKFSELDNQLTLSSETMTYRVEGVKPDKAGAVGSYQEFADWSARLNSCRPGNLPPHARMELSKQLADRGLIPQKIHRTIVVPGRFGNKKLEVESRHMVNWGLSTKDHKRIETVGEQINTFEPVPFQVFTGVDKVAAKK